jgi:hypothetical protein
MKPVIATILITMLVAAICTAIGFGWGRRTREIRCIEMTTDARTSSTDHPSSGRPWRSLPTFEGK